jgi:hypothetical protein
VRRRKNEVQNNKFAFLKPGDPFNPYYVATVIANGGKPPAGSADAAGSSAKISGESTVKPVKKAAAGVMPLEPPKPQYIVNRPAGAQPLDMDVIMLTAQFVARNGRSFLTGLANRESKNPMFDFLKPTHPRQAKSESAPPSPPPPPPPPCREEHGASSHPPARLGPPKVDPQRASGARLRGTPQARHAARL